MTEWFHISHYQQKSFHIFKEDRIVLYHCRLTQNPCGILLIMLKYMKAKKM